MNEPLETLREISALLLSNKLAEAHRNTANTRLLFIFKNYKSWTDIRVRIAELWQYLNNANAYNSYAEHLKIAGEQWQAERFAEATK